MVFYLFYSSLPTKIELFYIIFMKYYKINFIFIRDICKVYFTLLPIYFFNKIQLLKFFQKFFRGIKQLKAASDLFNFQRAALTVSSRCPVPQSCLSCRRYRLKARRPIICRDRLLRLSSVLNLKRLPCRDF